MSSDEADLIDHLEWIDNLDQDSDYTSLSPRYQKSSLGDLAPSNDNVLMEHDHIRASRGNDTVRVIAWWEFSANKNNLLEWDEEVQYYDESTDRFRKWTKKYDLDFETVSLLRSLRLDDTLTLSALSSNQLSVLRRESTRSFNKLDKAISSLTMADHKDRSVEFEDEILSDDNFADDTEFNLRPKLTRNLPLRRSTRSGKKIAKNFNVRTDGIRTIGPGATRSRQGYHDNRRLSWETFAFFNQNKPNSAPSGPGTTTSPKSGLQTIEHFKFPISEKKEKIQTKRSRAFFPSITPI